MSPQAGPSNQQLARTKALIEVGIHSPAEQLTASVHANKRGEAWIKHLTRLENAAATPTGRRELADSLERIDRQLKADPRIMVAMDFELAKKFTVKLFHAARVVDSRTVKYP